MAREASSASSMAKTTSLVRPSSQRVCTNGRGNTGTLRHEYRLGRLKSFDDFKDPQAFDHLLAKIGKPSWYVYAKPSMYGQYVAEYLGRYTHRVGLANSRILDITDEGVTFRTRGEDQITLRPVEFLRRFVKHVLPRRFHKIRRYGLYTQNDLALAARHVLPTASGLPEVPANYRQHLLALTGRDLSICPHCASFLVSQSLPNARAPPQRAV